MLVLTPSDVEQPTIELDGGIALCEPPPVGSDERGARAAAARPSDPGAPLPDAQPNIPAVHDYGDADVGAFRKYRVMLEDRPHYGEIDLFDILDKKGRVGVADVGANGLGQRAAYQVDAIGIHSPGQRDLVPVRQRLRLQQPRKGLDPHPRIAGLAMQQLGDAARGITTGLGLAAVGIADA